MNRWITTEFYHWCETTLHFTDLFYGSSLNINVRVSKLSSVLSDSLRFGFQYSTIKGKINKKTRIENFDMGPRVTETIEIMLSNSCACWFGIATVSRSIPQTVCYTHTIIHHNSQANVSWIITSFDQYVIEHTHTVLGWFFFFGSHRFVTNKTKQMNVPLRPKFHRINRWMHWMRMNCYTRENLSAPTTNLMMILSAWISLNFRVFWLAWNQMRHDWISSVDLCTRMKSNLKMLRWHSFLYKKMKKKKKTKTKYENKYSTEMLPLFV